MIFCLLLKISSRLLAKNTIFTKFSFKLHVRQSMYHVFFPLTSLTQHDVSDQNVDATELLGLQCRFSNIFLKRFSDSACTFDSFPSQLEQFGALIYPSNAVFDPS